MKTKISLVLLCLAISTVSFSQEIINYFEVADNIAIPVTIKTRLGTYQIYGGERIDGNLYSVEAWDAAGNKIVNTQPYKTEIGTNKPTVRHYRFKDIYESSERNSENDYARTNSSGANWDGISDAMVLASRVKVKGIPNLQIRGGWDNRYGEYLSFRGEVGGKASVGIAAGIGKNFFADETENSYFAELFISVNVNNSGYSSYSITASHFGATWDYDNLFGIQFEYSHFFEKIPRLGYFVDLFLGGSMITDDFYPGIGAGISWKLFYNKKSIDE